MKNNDDKKVIKEIIDKILESEAVWSTNIYVGLKKGLKNLNKVRINPQTQFGILISDGNYNRGKNPLKITKKFPKLYVIGIPADNDADMGIETCREIAKAGKEKFYAVEDYKEINRALITLLAQN